ncbi:hypothetical protein Tco_0860180 [Tanacetum coccineum]|uniref:Uncharacterized protein n=1 Tax=Tanacetum coccineum TaxID=301880 RepID=A0ABQ5BH52_9ASTR
MSSIVSSMNEQSRYKQEKTKTRPKKAKLKSQIKSSTLGKIKPIQDIIQQECHQSNKKVNIGEIEVDLNIGGDVSLWSFVVDTPYRAMWDTAYWECLGVRTTFDIFQNIVLDMAFWGFLGVGTTFDIFQNILFPYSLNTAYCLLQDTAYWILFPSWSLVSASTDTPYLP